ncbi:MAG: hypothetical protein LBM70_05170 [Victivallales bacterium]|jgi:hypothetical protein|nr:hypothetical protein [Victivallales bacterium]
MIEKNYFELANEIIGRLKEFGPELSGCGKHESTGKILDLFHERGEKKGYFICPSKEVGNSEWLYDMIWFKNTEGGNKKDIMLKEVCLVLECEWSHCYSDVSYDFEKLLLANAPIKVMIFEEGKCKFKDICDKMKESIKNYRNGSPGIYILACYCGSSSEMKVLQLLPSN